MEKFVEIQAANVDVAVEKALAELNAKKDDVDIEVLSKGGLFSKAKVKVTLKRTLADDLADFVNGTLERMDLASRATVTEIDNTLNVEIAGEDSSAAIGYRGEALDAFQYLAMTFLNEHGGNNKKIVIDCENYREKRRETLTQLAERLAQKAYRLRRKIALEPMNPFERRIVHSALVGSEIARTESEGEDLNRHVVIIPVGVELKDERPIVNGDRDRRDGRDGRHGDRRDRNRKGGRKPARREHGAREEEPEVEDGNVYRYFTQQDDFKKPAAQAGPPKFKSFGGKKRF